jgi:hypothetical protein
VPCDDTNRPQNRHSRLLYGPILPAGTMQQMRLADIAPLSAIYERTIAALLN